MPLTIETILSPALYPFRTTEESHITVVIDILRFTTSVVAAFDFHAAAVIPTMTLEEARKLKEKGYKVAAERDGLKLDFADYGNSASDFMNPDIEGKTIAYSTTNGTRAIMLAAANGPVVAASFSNLYAVAEWLSAQKQNIVILCSGWKNQFCIEDTLCAGAFISKLTETTAFEISGDASVMAVGYWEAAQNNLAAYIKKASHHQRLLNLGVNPMLEYTIQTGISNALPVFENGWLTDKNKNK